MIGNSDGLKLFKVTKDRSPADAEDFCQAVHRITVARLEGCQYLYDSADSAEFHFYRFLCRPRGLLLGIERYNYRTHSDAVNRGVCVLALPLGSALKFSGLTMAGLKRRIQDCRNYLENKEVREGLYTFGSGKAFCRFFEVRNEENRFF